MRPEEDERLLSEDEVEERFNIPSRFLQRARSRGEPPGYVRIGRLVRYEPAEISRFIASQRRGSSVEEDAS